MLRSLEFGTRPACCRSRTLLLFSRVALRRRAYMAGEEQTRGKGLAENSALPKKLSELIAELCGCPRDAYEGARPDGRELAERARCLRSARPEAPRGGPPARGDRAQDG